MCHLFSDNCCAPCQLADFSIFGLSMMRTNLRFVEDPCRICPAVPAEFHFQIRKDRNDLSHVVNIHQTTAQPRDDPDISQFDDLVSWFELSETLDY